MVRTISFGKYQKIWAMILGDSIFLLYVVYSTDLNIYCSGSFSHQVRFHSFMFMHCKIYFYPGCLYKW